MAYFKNNNANKKNLKLWIIQCHLLGATYEMSTTWNCPRLQQSFGECSQSNCAPQQFPRKPAKTPVWMACSGKKMHEKAAAFPLFSPHQYFESCIMKWYQEKTLLTKTAAKAKAELKGNEQALLPSVTQTGYNAFLKLCSLWTTICTPPSQGTI